ncbi:uncharacterized protein LOC133318718 isoform X1 [Danaus plexippus]|uniref:uncharacterized protein LOC133318718 isoform X1 n=1 Tax=Danaus plexippus TaxID=13037 RepID=UPI002AB2CB1C|nr:uncharacterized protein LOC133318718 isoform X1 [Danaus plexippus]
MKTRKMSHPAELSFDEILKFMLANNGKVTNHELVKHFKVFLMNPDMRDEARNTFKKHVNALAIIKNQNNEKWLILKKKYLNNPVKQNEEVVESKITELPVVPNVSNMETESVPQSTYKHAPPLQLNQDFNILANIIQDSSAAATPTQASEIPLEIPVSESKESLTAVEETPPKVHPRRKSSDKILAEKRSSVASLNLGSRSSIPSQDLSELSEKSTLTLSSSRSESMLIDHEQKISVKERKQMFNRMASESDVLKTQKLSFNNSSVDEEDRASLEQKETDPLDSKQKQWIICAARGEYHSLAKMCKENAKLVRTKDPFTGVSITI